MQLFCIMQYTFYVNILWKMWEWLPTTTYSHASWALGHNIQPHRIIYILAFLTKYTVET